MVFGSLLEKDVLSHKALVLVVMLGAGLLAADPVRIGRRLEPLVDEFLLEKLTGDAQQVLHRPEPREVVLVTGAPWEGNTSAYYTIFRDGDLFRMYYRGSHANKKKKFTHREVTCYAQSKDGVHWTKPALGLFEFQGSKKNNIVWDGIGTHCFAVFKDTNPACLPEARYKAISAGRSVDQKGLYVFQSADAIHWKLIKKAPVITEGAFDSQNLAFWDPHAKLYRGYHRTFTGGVRAILTETSRDYLHWTRPVLLTFPAGTPREHLYTNAIRNYPGAPHILFGFPTRYLPQEGERVEPIFMTSRDGTSFHRWPVAVVPESAPKDRGGNRSNYMTWGLSELPGHPGEFSVYATEAYYEGLDSRVRRFVFRKDGIVSVHATAGALYTRPLVFSGQQLVINYRVADGGHIRVELQDAEGKTLKGFAASKCRLLQGDKMAQVVSWQGGSDLSRLIGTPVRVKFQLKSADLFSIRFR